MTDRIRTLAGTSALVASLMAAPALAQEAAIDWDFDQSGSVSQDEFTTGFGDAGAFGTLDTDGDALLSQDEYDAGLSAGYDADASGTLDTDETAMMEADDWGEAFSNWDTDADAMLNEDEYTQGVFSRYDEDRSGDWTEGETALFSQDVDKDGIFSW